MHFQLQISHYLRSILSPPLCLPPLRCAPVSQGNLGQSASFRDIPHGGAFTSLPVVAVSNSIVLLGTEANGVINYLLSAGTSSENNQYAALVIHSSQLQPTQAGLTILLACLGPSKRLNNANKPSSRRPSLIKVPREHAKETGNISPYIFFLMLLTPRKSRTDL